MSSYGKNFSTRLFIQAAFTGLLAPAGSRGTTWMVATFALAVGAAVVGAIVRDGHERTRELVIGFEAVAVAVGVVGLMGHHYIPGTIVGIAALITAVQHPMTSATAVPMPAMQPMPMQPMPAMEPMASMPVEPEPVATVPMQPEPVAAVPMQPEAAAPAVPMVTGVRAMNILPGR